MTLRLELAEFGGHVATWGEVPSEGVSWSNLSKHVMPYALGFVVEAIRLARPSVKSRAQVARDLGPPSRREFCVQPMRNSAMTCLRTKDCLRPLSNSADEIASCLQVIS